MLRRRLLRLVALSWLVGWWAPRRVEAEGHGTVTRTLTEVPVDIQDFGQYGNIYARHLVYERAGKGMRGHSHHFDHVTLLTHGLVDIAVWDAQKTRTTRRYSAPALIHTPAELVHEITPLEDDTQYWCIFAVRGLDGSVLSSTEATDGRRVTGF